MASRRPCWQAASVSHFNHHLMGLATAVDSLVAIRRLAFDEGRVPPAQFRRILADDWAGYEALRREAQTGLPRYGQDHPEPRELTAVLGRMWVEEVERASRGLGRLAMWPGFYSHMVHLQAGANTGATPDGRGAGDPLSENLNPSHGTPPCAPTEVLATMARLPLDCTPSGAATLTLPIGVLGDPPSPEDIQALLQGYFALGGLHLQVNVVSARALIEAMDDPARHPDLMVRVTGFSALFARLSREVQLDIIRRCQGVA